MTDRMLTVEEAAKMNKSSKQAIYVAVRDGRIKGTKDESGRWTIQVSDLSNYMKFKYSRLKSTDHNGKLLYEPQNGRYSPVQFAEALGVPIQRIYYLMRTGKLPFVWHPIKYKGIKSMKKVIECKDLTNMKELCKPVRSFSVLSLKSRN